MKNHRKYPAVLETTHVLTILRQAWHITIYKEICIPVEGDLRLVDNGQVTELSGLLQIYHKQQFYYICDDSFGRQEAEVFVSKFHVFMTERKVFNVFLSVI